MSDTPRTDAELNEICEGNKCWGYVRIEFARQLERELNGANASHAKTLRLAQQLKDDLVATEHERDDLRTKLQHANAAALRAMNAKVPLIADNARLVAELAELHKQFDALRNSQQQP